MHCSRHVGRAIETMAPALGLLLAAAQSGCARNSDHIDEVELNRSPRLEAGTSGDSAPPALDASWINGATRQAGVPRAAIGGGGVPADHRPAAPSWLPPVSLGAPGWQQSQGTYCVNRDADIPVGDIAADERAVYALFAGKCIGYLDTSNPPPCRGHGTSLQVNDGTGWRPIYDTAGESALHIRVMPSGPVVLMGMPDPACRVAVVAGNGTYRCLPGIVNPVDAAGVTADLAYLLDANEDTTDVLALDGDGARTIATLRLNGRAIWADAQTVVVAGEQQSVYVREGTGPFAALAKVPAGNYESVWATGPRDIWMQNTVGQLVHYAGATWTTIEPPASQFVSHARLWGDGTSMYFSTGDAFGRWNGQTWETLLDVTRDGQIEGMAGRSSGEVFVAYRDRSFDTYACGGTFILWFDGMQFHRF